MTENLTSLSNPSFLDIMADMAKQIKRLESELLRLRKSSQQIVYHLLSTGATDMSFQLYSGVKVTPNSDATYTSAVPPAGYRVTLIILTSGTTPYTITFGSGFKTTGTLSTGSVSARVFVLQFISDGTNLYEASRTTAMVA